MAAPAHTLHVPAVERVVKAMREQPGETLALGDMADMAYLSPYYFSRVFREVTGVPPTTYLAALRLQEAKHLLLTTPASVSEVCFEVGYTGLGTFTARFAHLVGVPPARLRRQAEEIDGIVTTAHSIGKGAAGPTGGGVTGSVHAPDATPGLIFIGLFPTRIPQSAPVGGALLHGPGAYHIARVPDGRYYAMAAAFAPTTRGLAYLLPDDGLRVGGAPLPVTVRGGRAGERADIVLRSLLPTDPPLLTALPFLLVDRQWE